MRKKKAHHCEGTRRSRARQRYLRIHTYISYHTPRIPAPIFYLFSWVIVRPPCKRYIQVSTVCRQWLFLCRTPCLRNTSPTKQKTTLILRAPRPKQNTPTRPRSNLIKISNTGKVAGGKVSSAQDSRSRQWLPHIISTSTLVSIIPIAIIITIIASRRISHRKTSPGDLIPSKT